MFKINRNKFFKLIDKNPAILIGGMPIIRNGDVHYNFRQESNFHYLTGFNEPNAIALFLPKAKKKFILFVEIFDNKKILWEGKRNNKNQLRIIYGADDIYDIKQFSELISKFIKNKSEIYCNLSINNLHSKKMSQILNKRNLAQKKISIHDPNLIFAQLRNYKNVQEVNSIKKAAEITNTALRKTVLSMKSGMHEYELQGIFEGKCMELKSARQGFPPIIATGINACTLHYTQNQTKLKKQDLVLFDVGAEYNYYSADVSRTMPVSGKFSAVQSAIYQIVLNAQNAGIKKAIPGNTFGNVHLAAVKELYDGLVSLKIISNTNTNIEKKLIDIVKFFPHATSHWLGLDVHDIGIYATNKKDTLLKTGMVITVEPGLYFTNNLKIPKKYKGIGVRIEDDILITKSGNKILSNQFPRTIKAIEKLLAKK
ncbi:MAG: aminopeptidase P family protein [Dehalococcoidia bacterium]|jgi:Xaa-Pro aminopeptidase|nr:MAG: Xaa-Pro aminopeptidase [Chloroflexota bacterium]